MKNGGTSAFSSWVTKRASKVVSGMPRLLTSFSISRLSFFAARCRSLEIFSAISQAFRRASANAFSKPAHQCGIAFIEKLLSFTTSLMQLLGVGKDALVRAEFFLFA